MSLGCATRVTQRYVWACKVLDATYAAGCTFWDTADAYQDSVQTHRKACGHLPGHEIWVYARPGPRSLPLTVVGDRVWHRVNRAEPQINSQRCGTSASGRKAPAAAQERKFEPSREKNVIFGNPWSDIEQNSPAGPKFIE
ncbi:hypothetical protein C8R44DRAFT_733038 [Mycena epipterygia]|nr:hypothetical protein C8R44DRAFT_733038 [Mycena epipterygia]